MFKSRVMELPAGHTHRQTLMLTLLPCCVAGGMVALNASVTGPDMPFTYMWTALSSTGGLEISANATLPSTTFSPVTANPGATTNYTLSVTSNCNQTFNATTTVFVTGRLCAAPTITFPPTRVTAMQGEDTSAYNVLRALRVCIFLQVRVDDCHLLR